MAQDEVLVHVRFFNDGSVSEIAERPAQLSPQAWFDVLNSKYATKYHALAGGRAYFKLPQSDVSAAKASV